MTSLAFDAREPSFVDELVTAGLLLPTGSAGVWGRSAVFERVVASIERLIDRETESDGATVLRFPPVIARRHFERSEFVKSFPQLAGFVHAFQGDHEAHQELLARVESGGDVSSLVASTDVVLVPAACYPIYPTLTGLLPAGGKLCDVSSYCFRHEPSGDPTRMVAFRMREQVRIGAPDEVLSFRERWIARATAMFADLGVPAEAAPASDPFFGRGGRLLSLSQREQRLKFELLTPIVSRSAPTPVMSFNYHQDHFGRAFDIATADGAVAHTACVGFGLERVALSLFATHGLDPADWPVDVRGHLFS
jgi:seryl-tRNA synthetase